MPSRLTNFCAVCLLVLALCPFTSPFAAIDPGLLHGEMATDQGPLVKPCAGQDKASALPAFAAPDMVLLDLPATRVGVPIDHPVHHPYRSIVLRL